MKSDPMAQSSAAGTAESIFSRRRGWSAENVVGFMMKQAVDHPECISLAAGLADPTTLPVEITRQAAERMLGDESLARASLQYGTTEGSQRLRDLLLEYLASLEGVPSGELGVGSDQLVLSTGSQQMLALLCEATLDPGDICLIADTTYYVMLGTVTGLGARAVAVEADEDGLRIDSLERILESLEHAGELPRVKMIYVVSDFDNPRSVSLSIERRRQLVELVAGYADRQRILLVEDAAYRELYYDGEPRPSVWSCDPAGETVALVQTFSKCFSPGLRVGFGVLPRHLVAPVLDLKGNEDFGSTSFSQHLLATVFEDGQFSAHAQRLRGAYAAKRDALVGAADEHLGGVEGVNWLVPAGGLYVWMTVPERVDTGLGGSLFERAVNQEQVMYVPGDLCYIGTDGVRPSNQLRLSFGVETPERLTEGMSRLARAIRAEL